MFRVFAQIRSNEGLTFETSAFESLYGGQFTLSTQLITHQKKETNYKATFNIHLLHNL